MLTSLSLEQFQSVISVEELPDIYSLIQGRVLVYKRKHAADLIYEVVILWGSDRSDNIIHKIPEQVSLILYDFSNKAVPRQYMVNQTTVSNENANFVTFSIWMGEGEPRYNEHDFVVNLSKTLYWLLELADAFPTVIRVN